MLDISPFEKAFASLGSSLEVYGDQAFMKSLNEKQSQTIRAGVIQNFEFTYELSWKFIKRWLENNIGHTEIDGVSRRELFRYAAQSRLIDDVDLWMQFHKYRNLTSHTYDEQTAQEVAAIAADFSIAAKALLQCIQAKND